MYMLINWRVDGAGRLWYDAENRIITSPFTGLGAKGRSKLNRRYGMPQACYKVGL